MEFSKLRFVDKKCFQLLPKYQEWIGRRTGQFSLQNCKALMVLFSAKNRFIPNLPAVLPKLLWWKHRKFGVFLEHYLQFFKYPLSFYTLHRVIVHHDLSLINSPPDQGLFKVLFPLAHPPLGPTKNTQHTKKVRSEMIISKSVVKFEVCTGVSLVVSSALCWIGAHGKVHAWPAKLKHTKGTAIGSITFSAKARRCVVGGIEMAASFDGFNFQICHQ